MTELQLVLMQRDSLSAEEAKRMINIMKLEVIGGANPEELLFAIGLEPDYIYDLIY